LASEGRRAAFQASFPDMRMDLVQLVAEGDTVVGRFRCSATHKGAWRGEPATGRRFEAVDEVYFFTFQDGRIADAWGLEDTVGRLRQLGLQTPEDASAGYQSTQPCGTSS